VSVALALAALARRVAGAEAATWRTLQSGGAALFLRHASTVPGVGDPPGFRLDDCATQRNLSAAGRQEAERWGNALRVREVRVDAVLSSAWCRCRDTAALAFGRYEVWAPLNSFFSDRHTEAQQTRAVRERITAWRSAGILVLVTHQVNITAATGVTVAPGSAVVVRPTPGGPEVVGELPPA
jgi:phosphohistidine phosphatase SixA